LVHHLTFVAFLDHVSDKQDLVGMAAFLRGEAEDERGHALEFIDFANKRNIPIRLETLEAPGQDWKNVEELWSEILDAEQENTNALLALDDAACDCKDHAVTAFLQPFHLEQVNSEDHLSVILAKVKEENRTPGLIRQLDTELASEASSHVK
jgi:ferritin